MITYPDASEDEMKAIEELRERMEGDMDPDLYEDYDLFYRFLKVQEFNVYNAELMLRKHLRWRAKHDVKNIKQYEVPEVVREYFHYILLGYDKEGCIVNYSPVGNIDFLGVLRSIQLNDIKKTMIRFMSEDEERLRIRSKELGRNISQCVFICNLEHLTFRKVTDKKAIIGTILVLKSLQNNYPERVKAAYVINGSRFASFIFSYLKLAVGSSLLSKLHFYYDDSWKEDILKAIDADVLPAFLGGTRTDPDGNPMCNTFIKHGEPVPEKYYLSNRKKSLAGKDGVKKITLSRADFHEEFLEVDEPGSSIEWEFETECRDIGFGVFYEDIIDGEEKMVELIPHQRIDTEDCSETGMWVCQNVGRYVFLFDNTYSWVRSKEIYYRVKVVPPNQKKTDVFH